MPLVRLIYLIVWLWAHPVALALTIALLGTIAWLWFQQQKREMEASDRLKAQERGRGGSIWDDR